MSFHVLIFKTLDEIARTLLDGRIIMDEMICKDEKQFD